MILLSDWVVREVVVHFFAESLVWNTHFKKSLHKVLNLNAFVLFERLLRKIHRLSVLFLFNFRRNQFCSLFFIQKCQELVDFVLVSWSLNEKLGLWVKIVKFVCCSSQFFLDFLFKNAFLINFVFQKLLLIFKFTLLLLLGFQLLLMKLGHITQEQSWRSDLL